MSRADETTQVDYSLLDDRELGETVAEKVLGWEPFMRHPVTLFDYEGGKYGGRDVVEWWGAGLVIDRLRAEGLMWNINDHEDADGLLFTLAEVGPIKDQEISVGDAYDKSPIRAILIAALRAVEASV